MNEGFKLVAAGRSLMSPALTGRAFTGLALAGLAACVTINIYFPAAAAEKAADKIIDEVWQLKDGAKNAPAEKPPAPAPNQ